MTVLQTTYPPVMPSLPFVTSRSGSTDFLWDGLDANDEPMTVTTEFVQVHIDSFEDFEIEDEVTLHGTIRGSGILTLSTLDYDTNLYVRFVAVNTSGQRSEPTDAVLFNVSRTEAGDLDPAATASPPPGSSPTPVIAGLGVGTITWTLTPVAGVGIRYRVWAQDFTSPPGAVTQDAAHLVYDGSAPMGTFDSINGAPLIPDGSDSTTPLPTYYVQAQAYNQWGNAPSVSAVSNGAIPRRAGQKEFSSDIIYANRVELNQIQGGTANFQFIVGNEVATAVAGNDRVGMNPEGFFADKANGDRKVDIPATGDPTFAGALQALSATFVNGFEARGLSSLATGSEVNLASALPNPSSPPVVWTTRDTTQLATTTKPVAGGGFVAPIGATPEHISAPVWDAANGRWLLAALWKESATVWRTWIYKGNTGTWQGTNDTVDLTGYGFRPGLDAFIIGTRLVVVRHGSGSTGPVDMSAWVIATSLQTKSESVTGLSMTNTDGMTVGTDGTDLIFAKIAPTAGTHETLTIANASDVYAHSRPITFPSGSISVGAISRSWALGIGVTDNQPFGVFPTELKSVIMARNQTTQFDYSAVVAFKSLTSNVATIETSAKHSFEVGESVTITGVDATFNGSYTVTAVTANTFTYAKVAANVTRVASGGAVSYETRHLLIVSTKQDTGFTSLGFDHVAFRVESASGSNSQKGSWYGSGNGLGWNSTDGYLYAYDRSTGVLEKHAHNKASGGFVFGYTWTDDNATGSRHETMLSPLFTGTCLARSKTVMQTSGLPVPFDTNADGVPDPTTDDPGGARFYVRNPTSTPGISPMWRLAGSSNGFVSGTYGSPVTLTVDDQLPLDLDAPTYSVDTGLTKAPSSNSFASSTLLTASKITSQGDAGGRGAISIKGDGYASIPGLQMAFYKRVQGTVTALTTAVQGTVAGFSTVVIDEGSWSYASGVFTCIKPGTYLVFGQCSFASNATGTRRTLLLKNGGATGFAVQTGMAANSGLTYQSCMGLERFAVNDTVSMLALQNSGGTLNTSGDGYTALTFVRLGA